MAVFIPQNDLGIKKKKPKYRNTKCRAMGKKFDSVGERDRWFFLQEAMKMGQISNLRRQVAFDLGVCKYIADYVYDRLFDGKPVYQVIEDFKGGYKLPNDFRIKAKMMEQRGTPIKIIKSATAPIG